MRNGLKQYLGKIFLLFREDAWKLGLAILKKVYKYRVKILSLFVVQTRLARYI